MSNRMSCRSFEIQITVDGECATFRFPRRRMLTDLFTPEFQAYDAIVDGLTEEEEVNLPAVAVAVPRGRLFRLRQLFLEYREELRGTWKVCALEERASVERKGKYVNALIETACEMLRVSRFGQPSRWILFRAV